MQVPLTRCCADFIVMKANRRVKSYSAAFARLLLMLILIPVLITWLTLFARVEASENSPEAAGVNASGNSSGEYRLAPGDRLAIKVFDQEQLSGNFIVGGSGEIMLPLAGKVNVAGLTVAEAQQVIQERFADGVLAQPVVSVHLPEYRPIFVGGDVRRPGSYRFMFGASVKAAIATAGGEGSANEQLLSVVMSEFITAEERVRQLEANRVGLLVRKARLEAQRDERESFVMLQPVVSNISTVDFKQVYAAESDTFSRLQETYRSQLAVLEQQRPRIQAEIQAGTDQIATEGQRLNIVNGRLADLEHLFDKGFLRKDVLIGQQIEKALVQAELSRLEGQVAHLRQNMGDLNVKVEEVKANYKRQILGDLQEASQRLREIEAMIGTSRKLRDVRAEYASIRSGDKPEYIILINRTSGSGTVALNATDETLLEPGDVVEVKLKRQEWSSPTEAAQNLKVITPYSTVAESIAPRSR
jgi:polysaccharide export outer membrane protein